MKNVSEFSKWFESQHGKRPSKLPLDELMADRNNKCSIAENAKYLVDRCNMWEEKRTSALYAWQARSNVEVSRPKGRLE